MKIAVVRDDGKSISQHFGRAQKVMNITENVRVGCYEIRSKT